MSHSPARWVYRLCLKLSRKKAKKTSTVKDELLQEKCAQFAGLFRHLTSSIKEVSKTVTVLTLWNLHCVDTISLALLVFCLLLLLLVGWLVSCFLITFIKFYHKSYIILLKY